MATRAASVRFAAVLAAVLVLAGAGIARGDDGDPLVVGTDNVGQSPTALEYPGPLDPAAGPGFQVKMDDVGHAMDIYAAMSGPGLTVGVVNGSGIVSTAGGTAIEAIGGLGGPGLYADNSAPGGGGAPPLNPAIVARSVDSRFNAVEALRAEALLGDNGLYGRALNTIGEVRFQQSSGMAVVAAGTKKVSVQLLIDLDPDSMAFATSNGPGGMVRYVKVNAAADAITIFLTGTATSDTPVAWFVISGG